MRKLAVYSFLLIVSVSQQVWAALMGVDLIGVLHATQSAYEEAAASLGCSDLEAFQTSEFSQFHEVRNTCRRNAFLGAPPECSLLLMLLQICGLASSTRTMTRVYAVCAVFGSYAVSRPAR